MLNTNIKLEYMSGQSLKYLRAFDGQDAMDTIYDYAMWLKIQLNLQIKQKENN